MSHQPTGTSNHKSQILTVMTVLLLAATAFIIPGLPVAGGEGNTIVAGYVTDSRTGDPIEGAHVYLVNGEFGYNSTDENGYYEVHLDHGGDYEISVHQDGYSEYVDYVTLTENNTHTINVELDPKNVVQGYISGDDRAPVENAQIVLESGDDSYWEWTDEVGYYHTYVGDPGDYDITVTADGYKKHRGSLEVAEGEENWYNATLEPAPLVKGYITDRDSSDPVAHADLYFQDGENYYYASTNDRGYYELYAEPGSYQVQIYADEYYQYEGDCTVPDQDEFWFNATLQRKPPQNSYIKGYVTEATRGAIEDVDISFWGDHDSYWASTDRDGYYVVNVRSDTFDISANREGYHRYGYEDLRVGVNETVWHNFTMEPRPPENSVIKGYVTELVRGPIEDANVALWNNEDYYSTRTDDAGYYEITLRAGSYELEIRHDDYQKHYNSNYRIGEDETDWYNATLEPRPPENSVIKGYVTELVRGPIEDANVALWNNEDYYSTRTDDAGYYEITLRAGSYELEIRHDDYRRHYNSNYRIGEDETDWYNATLEALPPEDSVIKGYVTEPVRGPIEDAHVALRNDDDYYAAWTDDAGYYEISLRAGRYDIEVRHDDYRSHHNHDYRIGENETDWYNATLEALPPENSVIKGYVTELVRGPIENAHVSFDSNDDYYSTGTDEHGYYEVTVREGSYSVGIHKDGYRGHQYEYLEVGDDDTVWYNASLEEKPPVNSWIRGYLSEEVRNPVEDAQVHFWNGEDHFMDTTDDMGYYEVQVYSDSWEIWIDADGYHGHHDTDLFVEDGEELWYNATLHRKPPQTATIRGYVTDGSRGGIDGVRVEVHDDQDWNSTGTDSNGYYEINVAAGNWHVGFRKFGYYHENDKVWVADHEVLWYNITLEMARMILVQGYITTNDTRGPVADEWIDFWSERYQDGTMTDDAGYYVVELAANLEYHVSVQIDGYRTLEKDIHFDDDAWFNITLEPLPPTDIVVRGYVDSYQVRAGIEAMVVLFNLKFQTPAMEGTDDTGYYEVHGWSGINGIMSMADEHYQYFHIVNLSAGEHWYNITMYPVPESTGSVQGHIHHGSRGPVEGAHVFAVNEWTGMFPEMDEATYVTETDDTGYFYLDLPEGLWYLAVAYEDDSRETTGKVIEVLIEGNVWENITLPDAPDRSEIRGTFEGWNTIHLEMQGPFEFEGGMYLARLYVDMFTGNRDGTVTADEAAFFEEFLNAMQGDNEEDDDPDDDDTTEDDFEVDGIAYKFDNVALKQSFTGLEGAVTSMEPVHMRMEMTMHSLTPIPEADTHTISVNMTGDDDGDGIQTITLILPTGFILQSHTASSSVSVDGEGTDTVTLEWTDATRGDSYEVVELTVTRIEGNIPPRANAGDDISVNHGDMVTLQGTGTDADGTIVLYEWDFDGDGVYDWSSGSSGTATHTYPAPGTYTAILRVTDNEGATHTDTVTVHVNAIPLVDAGEDQPALVGQTVTFTAIASDDDGTIVLYEWDFDGDGVFDLTTTDPMANFTYAAPGNYTVTVQVTDNHGALAEDTLTVRVASQIFVDLGDHRTVNAGDTVVFNAPAVSAGQDVVFWQWDFDGDGTYDLQTTGPTANFTYLTPGTYPARVQVTDSGGNKASDTATITVRAIHVPSPDVIVDNVVISNLKPKDGDKVTITVTLKNIGDAPAENAVLTVKLNGQEVASFQLGNIPVNGTVTRDHTWTAVKGTHTLEVRLTYTGGEDEVTRTLEVSKKDDSPGFGALVALGAVGVALVLFERKRRR